METYCSCELASADLSGIYHVIMEQMLNSIITFSNNITLTQRMCFHLVYQLCQLISIFFSGIILLQKLYMCSHTAIKC